VQNRDKKIAESFPQPPKKKLTHLALRAPHHFFLTPPPWRGQPRGSHKRAFAEPPLAPGLWNVVCIWPCCPRGAVGNKRRSDVICDFVLEAGENFAQIFSAFLNSPLQQNAQRRNKKNRASK
jgi:hypothetical protein